MHTLGTYIRTYVTHFNYYVSIPIKRCIRTNNNYVTQLCLKSSPKSISYIRTYDYVCAKVRISNELWIYQQ